MLHVWSGKLVEEGNCLREIWIRQPGFHQAVVGDILVSISLQTFVTLGWACASVTALMSRTMVQHQTVSLGFAAMGSESQAFFSWRDSDTQGDFLSRCDRSGSRWAATRYDARVLAWRLHHDQRTWWPTANQWNKGLCLTCAMARAGGDNSVDTGQSTTEYFHRVC